MEPQLEVYFLHHLQMYILLEPFKLIPLKDPAGSVS